jgi:DNA-binding winged helix-turn-helix (wHTH) protein
MAASPLTPKLFDVLRMLVENHGHLVDTETFMTKIWDGSFVEEGALTRSVSMLRKTLGDTVSEPVYIETVPKSGYRFVAPVTGHVAIELSPSSTPATWTDARGPRQRRQHFSGSSWSPS